jgi:hypothetical protein
MRIRVLRPILVTKLFDQGVCAWLALDDARGSLPEYNLSTSDPKLTVLEATVTLGCLKMG